MPVPADLQIEIEKNLRQHFSWPARCHANYYLERPAALLVDSGFPSDSLNIIFWQTSDETHEGLSLLKTIYDWQDDARSFSVWLSPQAAALGPRVAALGLTEEIEIGMALDLATFEPAEPSGDLVVRQAQSQREIEDFGHVIAANWSPPDSWIEFYYKCKAGPLVELPRPVTCFVGYLQERPVAVAEATTTRGFGLYNVATLESFRRRGFATAILHAALSFAKRKRPRGHALLQCSPELQTFYARLGFRPLGVFHTYSTGSIR